jgi:hypothetical protein
MSEENVEVSLVEALWLPLVSTTILIVLLITCLRKGSTLVPELSTKAVLITGKR